MHPHLHIPWIAVLGVLAYCCSAQTRTQNFEQLAPLAQALSSSAGGCTSKHQSTSMHRRAQGSPHAVTWVRKFSSSSDFEAANTIWREIAEFVVGSTPDCMLRPYSLFVQSDGEYFVLDQGRESLLHVDTMAGAIEKIVPEKQNALPSLVGICGYKDGSLLLSDSRLNALFLWTKVDGLNQFITTVPLQQPTGIAWSSERREIWVAETRLHRIAVLNEDGTLIRTIGMRGTTNGKFNFPTAMCIHDGYCYVIDAMNFRVQVFDSDGRFVSSFGAQGNATGYFAAPRGIACDSHGNIYVSDALFHTVQIFDSEGRYLLNFGTQGRGDGEFWMPAGLCIQDDFIYIADSYNARIQVFQLIHGEHEGR